MAGTADLASPPVLSPHAQVASAPTLQCPTRDECDIHDMVSEQADIIINKPAWDGVYHRFFSERHFLLSSRTCSFDTCSLACVSLF
jgi:hypothetical protein